MTEFLGNANEGNVSDTSDTSDATSETSETPAAKPAAPVLVAVDQITSGEQLLDAYRAGQRDFSGVRLPKVHLGGATLDDANFAHADFSEANLSSARLRNTVFASATLVGANLSSAEMNNARLSFADLSRARLQDASLVHADLGNALLTSASLTYATLAHASLEGADLSDTELYDTKLFDANLRSATLRGARCYYAKFTRADLSDSNCAGANFSDADFSEATLAYVDFANACLENVVFTDAKRISSTSHDILTELLRQKAGQNYAKRQVAGLVRVSRDWCWSEFSRIALAHWSLELRVWIVQTLSAYGEEFTRSFTQHPFFMPNEIMHAQEAGIAGLAGAPSVEHARQYADAAAIDDAAQRARAEANGITLPASVPFTPRLPREWDDNEDDAPPSRDYVRDDMDGWDDDDADDDDADDMDGWDDDDADDDDADDDDA